MTTLKTLAALVAVLFATSMGYAQQKVPSFKGTKVCVNFGGALAIEAKTTLVKMGVDPADFVDRNGDCRGVPAPHVRISISSPRTMQPSSENSSTYGSGGNYSSGGSYSRSGNWIAVDATATLVIANGEYRRIGFHSNAFQAGQISSSGSASGSTFSNSGGSSRNTPEDQTAGLATQHALHDLLHSAKSWTPGADKLIADTFAVKPNTVASTPTTTQTVMPASVETPQSAKGKTAVDVINAKADEMLAEAKKLEANAKAAKTEAKAKAEAEKRLKKAQDELDKAKKGAVQH